MSNTNYDVELNIAFDDAHKHYIPTYAVSMPYYSASQWPDYSAARYNGAISFDDGNETELHYVWQDYGGAAPPSVAWTDNYPTVHAYGDYYKPVEIPDSGIHSKIYFRNSRRSMVTFTSSNCKVKVNYVVKASFEVQFNLTGFAANQNASFRCSTVQKNTYQQYEWISATVYYKESTDEEYLSVPGVISGTWSDYTISTNLSFADDVVYDVYIVAVSDDNETAMTPVAQFTTSDAAAVATCIAPSGAFTSGEVTFVWSHATEYGTPQYAYDLEYSNNNGSSWTTVANHVITPNTNITTTINDAGIYVWRVRTYNTNDEAGEWAEASFVNQVPANPPTNLQVTTKGRPTVSWASVSQSAYQVQFVLGDSVIYDSGAVYTTETSHFVNQYFNDARSYEVRVRIYNSLGEVSDWVSTGYQQPSITDVEFSVMANDEGGVEITIETSEDFVHYFILRNNKLIAQADSGYYLDKYAVGITNYSVVGVTSDDQSDIQTNGIRAVYPEATLISIDGQQYSINKRVNDAYEIHTTNQADINKANFIGDIFPTHYPSNMRIKSFAATLFDDQGILEDLLGKLVFYADNFGNGGWCMVTAYDKADNFVKNSRGIYANEVALTLEVTNYDDSIEYPI